MVVGYTVVPSGTGTPHYHVYARVRTFYGEETFKVHGCWWSESGAVEALRKYEFSEGQASH